ncbi:MAG: class I SAM-dependent methyltransferase [Verrucomicrobiota bacterium]
MPAPIERFSNRVADYVRYRPDYPAALIDDLATRGLLHADASWADVGAGTGIWTRQLAPLVKQVFAVEPNPDMRAAAETFLAGLPNVRLAGGAAEATGLPGASFDVVTAAQAFHWFDHAAFSRECRRLLRPGGRVVLVWNERETDTTPFLRGYEQVLLEHAGDYREVNHQNITPEMFAAFFGPEGYELIEHPQVQWFDYAGLAGRLLSSSYVPTADHPRHPAMMAALRACFDATAEDGRVAFGYMTRAYLGTV